MTTTVRLQCPRPECRTRCLFEYDGKMDTYQCPTCRHTFSAGEVGRQPSPNTPRPEDGTVV